MWKIKQILSTFVLCKLQKCFYIALYHEQNMLKVLHALLPEQAGDILHIYALTESPLWRVKSWMWIIHAQVTHARYKLVTVSGILLKPCCEIYGIGFTNDRDTKFIMFVP